MTISIKDWLPTISEIETHLAEKWDSPFPTERWSGRCMLIADTIRETTEIGIEFGSYVGEIHPESSLDNGEGHVWNRVEMGDTVYIVDATRWVYENVDPYVYVTEAPDKDYLM